MYELQLLLCDKITPNDDDVKVRNANGMPVPILGIINLAVQIRNSFETFHFLFADKLCTAVILGFD